jgi:hypothetical protein
VQGFDPGALGFGGDVADSIDTGKPTQHRVLRQITKAIAALLERGVAECLGKPIPVRFEFQEPARGKADPHLTLINYWIERAGDRLSDRVLCKTEGGDEYFRAPPLLMVARYCVTAWAPVPDDQELLAAALRVVYDNGELEQTGTDDDAIHFEDKPTLDLSTRFSIDEHRFVCESFGMPFRPAIRLDVNFKLDSERKTPIKRVKERVVDYRKMDG